MCFQGATVNKRIELTLLWGTDSGTLAGPPVHSGVFVTRKAVFPSRAAERAPPPAEGEIDVHCIVCHLLAQFSVPLSYGFRYYGI